jgi:hypothetical protein
LFIRYPLFLSSFFDIKEKKMGAKLSSTFGGGESDDDDETAWMNPPDADILGNKEVILVDNVMWTLKDGPVAKFIEMIEGSENERENLKQEYPYLTLTLQKLYEQILERQRRNDSEDEGEESEETSSSEEEEGGDDGAEEEEEDIIEEDYNDDDDDEEEDEQTTTTKDDVESSFGEKKEEEEERERLPLPSLATVKKRHLSPPPNTIRPPRYEMKREVRNDSTKLMREVPTKALYDVYLIWKRGVAFHHLFSQKLLSLKNSEMSSERAFQALVSWVKEQDENITRLSSLQKEYEEQSNLFHTLVLKAFANAQETYFGLDRSDLVKEVYAWKQCYHIQFKEGLLKMAEDLIRLRIQKQTLEKIIIQGDVRVDREAYDNLINGSIIVDE